MQTTTTIALRDWASTIEALAAGNQILLLRKGGIHEETRHFAVQSDQFFLYPAYEHQKEELLKPEFQGEIAKTLTHWSPEQTETEIRYFAQLQEDIQLLDETALELIYPHHIWTHVFAAERLKWKKTIPLHVLLLRVYKLDQPVQIPILPEYSGCKSWLQLPDNLLDLSAEPVLSDEAFAREVEQVKEKLATTAV